MANSIGSIAQFIRDGIPSIPSSVDSGTHLNNLVSDAKRLVQNFTNATITDTDITDKYVGVLTNFGKALVHSQIAGVGIDYNVSLGAFQVQKGASNDANVGQAQFFLSLANNELKLLGRGNINMWTKVV